MTSKGVPVNTCEKLITCLGCEQRGKTLSEEEGKCAIDVSIVGIVSLRWPDQRATARFVHHVAVCVKPVGEVCDPRKGVSIAAETIISDVASVREVGGVISV